MQQQPARQPGPPPRPGPPPLPGPPGGRPAAVVLAGGGSRRMGGTDKTRADLAGRTLLDRVLDALPRPATVVVVGPARTLPDGVLRALERPPGAGPAAAVIAGWRVLRERPPLPDAVLVLAGDAPFVAPALPRLLAALRAAPGAAAAVGVDPDGALQPLLAAFTPAALERAAAGDAPGRAARRLLDGLDVVRVPLTAAEVADVDTPDDLAAARRRLGRPGGP